MKKFNKNAVLFALVMLFLVYGLCSRELVHQLYGSLKGLYADILDGEPKALENFTAKVDSASNSLRYRSQLLDLNSAKENLAGTRVVFKEETTVVKADSGSLLGSVQTFPTVQQQIDYSVNYILPLQRAAQENEAGFLFCGVTPKTAYQQLPPNYPSYDNERYQLRLAAYEAAGVPSLDTQAVFAQTPLAEDEIFFVTDHHWTPKAGFYVSAAICSELERRYGFSYDHSKADLQNYQVETYENWFLGSYGKKVGTFFADFRVDDFDVITPKFETDFVETLSYRPVPRTGSFEDTMLYREYLKKDYYGMNNYAAYSGGDFRLQTLTNTKNPDGAVIVVVRKSYGCVITPFLAIHAGQLHVIDDRDGSYPSGDKVDVPAYIAQIKPDYVIVID